MSLTKSKGNMYEWVTHMHSHLAGECPHRCSYCYVQTGPARISGKYTGPVRLIEKELSINYGTDRTIFIEHMNDMFAEGVSDVLIAAILQHTWRYPTNTYVFQTKNTQRAFGFIDCFPSNRIIGTTIETNRSMAEFSDAPSPMNRAFGIARFAGLGIKTFVTIEPIMDFDVLPLIEMIKLARPSFVNIGADSKRCGLPEPLGEYVKALVAGLQSEGIEIRKKVNLERLLA